MSVGVLLTARMYAVSGCANARVLCVLSSLGGD